MVRIIADRFIVERLVGSGGMGEVFRARDLYGGHVAIQVRRERFKREARMRAEWLDGDDERTLLGVVREHVRTLARAGQWLL